MGKSAMCAHIVLNRMHSVSIPHAFLFLFPFFIRSMSSLYPFANMFSVRFLLSGTVHMFSSVSSNNHIT